MLADSSSIIKETMRPRKISRVGDRKDIGFQPAWSDVLERREVLPLLDEMQHHASRASITNRTGVIDTSATTLESPETVEPAMPETPSSEVVGPTA